MDKFNQFIHCANKFFLMILKDYLMIGFICAALLCILVIAMYIILPKRFEKMIHTANDELLNEMTPLKALVFICGFIIIAFTTAWPWVLCYCFKKEI